MPTSAPTRASLALPVLDEAVRERADAARNRRRILVAAERLIAERGVEAVPMDAIAAEAGVGKGTLFRRFGDRGGLLYALLDDRERALQEEMIRGAPPLGPGAPPLERLLVFGRRLHEHLELHADVIAAADAGRRLARFDVSVYPVYQAHVTALAREADPRADADYLADALLAPLTAEVFLYMRRVRELPLGRMVAGWERIVEGALA